MILLDHICGDTCLHYGENDLQPICDSKNLTNAECQQKKSEFYGDSTTSCKCGNSKIAEINKRRKWFGIYCCSTMPCERIADKFGRYNRIHCKDGVEKFIREKCGLNDCPTSQQVSSSALSINDGESTMKTIEMYVHT